MPIHHLTSLNPALLPHLNQLLDHNWELEQGERFLSNPDNALFLAFEDDIPVGFLTAYRLQRFDTRKAEVLLYEIGVDPDYQRRGIGTAMVAACKDWARAVGAHEIWVLTEHDNRAAKALYASTGGIEEAPGTVMFVYDLQE